MTNNRTGPDYIDFKSGADAWSSVNKGKTTTEVDKKKKKKDKKSKGGSIGKAAGAIAHALRQDTHYTRIYD